MKIKLFPYFPIFFPFSLLLMPQILVIISQPQELTECLPKDICGLNREIVNLIVNYYCICSPGYQGEFCQNSAMKEMKSKYERIEVKGPTANLLMDSKNDDGKFCVNVLTQCQNGEPQISHVEPICS